MQFDLQKELGLVQPSAKAAFPWLPVIAGLCCVNFLLVIITLFYALQKPALSPPSNEPPVATIAAVTSQMFAYTDVRINQLEDDLRDISQTLKQSRKTITAVEADQRISEKRDRRKDRDLAKAGLTNEDVISAINALSPSRQIVAPLSPEQQTSFDRLIDEDDSGKQVEMYIAAQTDPAVRASFIASIQNKGDRWFDNAMNAIEDDNPDAQYYIDNTMYFYSIMTDLSSDNATIALIEARKNQLNLARQNKEIQADVRLVEQKHEDTVKDLEEKMKPRLSPEMAEQEVWNQRRENSGIEVYRPSGLVKEYDTDWDQNPRVREEKGQGSSTPWSDIKR